MPEIPEAPPPADPASEPAQKASRPPTVLICVNRRYRDDAPSCAARGSLALADALEAGIRERCINIAVERQICLGRCSHGPTVRLAPGGDFFLGMCLNDLPNFLDSLEKTYGLKNESASKTPPVHLLGS